MKHSAALADRDGPAAPRRPAAGAAIREPSAPTSRGSVRPAVLRSFAEIDDVVDLLTMHIGAERLLVAARLDFGPRLSSDQIEQFSTQIEERIHERFPQVEQIFLDPTPISDPRARGRRAARESATSWTYPGNDHSGDASGTG